MNTAHAPIRSICLTLPAYNEASAIGPLLHEAARALQAESLQWSILVVDDGSVDSTADCVNEAKRSWPNINLIQHGRNRGLGPAIMTGLLAAVADRASAEHMVVAMDADLTHPPANIAAMRRAMDRGADLVIASRYQPGSRQFGVPLHRRCMSLGARCLFRCFLNLPEVRDYTCGFRAFRASLLDAGLQRFGPEGLITRSGFACTDELLVHLAVLRPVIREIPFTLRYDRKQGKSKMNLSKTVLETLRFLYGYRKELKTLHAHRDPADRPTRTDA